MENGLLRVKALLEGTGSIPVYITLDAYRQILKEKERFNCSVSEAIVKIIQRSQQQQQQQQQQTARTA
jgi:predicted CopG family antitoxin